MKTGRIGARPATFQALIFELQRYWARLGCVILQPYDMEVGAGTFHTATFLRSIGPEPWAAAYVQPSRRPTDGRYGDNPFRLQHYYQFQVLIKPSPTDMQELYLGSLKAVGFDPLVNDIRFVEDNWESPTLGAWGLGWEVWLNGMEISQFTYFQQVGGLDCRPVSGEITYGLERLAMYLQNVESVFDIVWTDGPQGRVTYRDVFHQNEVEQSKYNFEHADTGVLFRHFDEHEAACTALLALPVPLPLPAYEQVLKASHTFNLLDARRAISVTERARFILRVRTLARGVAQAYYASREALGFPLLATALCREGVGMNDRSKANIERRDFLFELGTEELPPKSLGALEAALRDGIASGLAAAALKHGAIESFATPRRLAVRVRRLSTQQPEQQIRRRGPPVRAAFDAAGAPTRAAQAFADSCGTPLATLGRERDDKGNEYLNYSGSRPGAATASLLPAIVSAALDALPIPKRMRWGAGEAQFVRPVHWLVMLHGAGIVPATLLGATAGRATRGHRFHAPRELPLRAPASYEKTLQSRGKVIASFAARRERIRSQVTEAASRAGGRAIMSDELLDEVTALVEWPVALAGQFDARFLSLPREVLIATLQDHQRYFGVEDAAGKLLPSFITVSNIESRDPDVVRSGNERVVRPRLTDAAFFWEQDRRTSLGSQVGALDRVTYQAQLGSIGDKVRRVATLAASLADTCRADPKRVARAAELCKCDLLSAMVGEFPELQGIIGAYYAAADGEDAEVAKAIREHYLPRGAGDALPATPTGLAVALADRIDTLAGIFAIGQKPSGTRDPFGLRRAAIGVLRMGRERALEFDLRALVERSVAAQPAADIASRVAAVSADVYGYIMERLRAQYLEDTVSGVSTEIFDAVLATEPRSLRDVDARVAALVSFLALPEAASLTAANKRIANILKKSASSVSVTIDTALLSAAPERALYAELVRHTPTADAALARGDYRGAFTVLAQLKPAIDAFFDGVMVNDPDAKLRDNRLALLGALRALFTRIADLSRLPG